MGEPTRLDVVSDEQLVSIIGSEVADWIRSDATEGGAEILGLGGDDIVDGGAGSDKIEGGEGNDSLDGGSGNDTIFGGDGLDSISGGTGNDLLSGDGGPDDIDGGPGRDTIDYADAAGSVRVTVLAQGEGYLDVDLPDAETNSGSSQQDDFRSVEVIRTSDTESDTLRIVGIGPAGADGPMLVDMGGERGPNTDAVGFVRGDFVDVSGMDEGVVVDLRDAANQFVAVNDGTLPAISDLKYDKADGLANIRLIGTGQAPITS